MPNGDLLNLSEKNIRIAEDSILSVALSDIRSFMKPSALILKVFKARYNVHNAHMMRRFQQVAAYCFNRYGSATNFGYVFVKEVLAKIESILLLAKKEEEVDLLLDLYFEVEY